MYNYYNYVFAVSVLELLPLMPDGVLFGDIISATGGSGENICAHTCACQYIYIYMM